MIGDRDAHVRLEIAAAAFMLGATMWLLMVASAHSRDAQRRKRDERRALHAELEQRDRRISELERALEGARFRAPKDGPAEDLTNGEPIQ